MRCDCTDNAKKYCALYLQSFPATTGRLLCFMRGHKRLAGLQRNTGSQLFEVLHGLLPLAF
jgi:hypothetical protein